MVIFLLVKTWVECKQTKIMKTYVQKTSTEKDFYKKLVSTVIFWIQSMSDREFADQ